MFDPPIIDKLKEKIRESAWKLGDISNIGQGMTTGLNSAFIIPTKTISEYKIEDAVLKKYVKTRDIKRYFINYRNLYMIYTPHGIDPNNIKNTLKYLENYKNQLKKRHPYRTGQCEWYELSVLRNKELFENSEEKIIVPNYATSNKFAFDNNKYYTLTDTYIITPKEKDISLKYILGILNSRLMNFYYKTISKLKRDEYMEYFTRPISEIPIKKINFDDPLEKSIYDSIVKNVESIISLTEKTANLNLDFNRYIGEPIIGKFKFRAIYEKISPSERDADKTTKGKIKKINAIEDNDWLKINVDYITNNKNEEYELKNHQVIKCRIADEDIRKFILHYINHNWKLSSTGNLLLKILDENLPVFNTDETENFKIMRKITKDYMKIIEDSSKLSAQLYQINANINSKIYDLYELGKQDRATIEALISEPNLTLDQMNESTIDLPEDE
jgi:outer membrane protein W